MNRLLLGKLANILGMLVMAANVVYGCASVRPPIQSGELVQVTYSCRLSDGRVVATNDANVAENDKIPKHRRVFVPRKYYKPALLVAGAGLPSPDFRNLPLPGLEAGLEVEISEKMIGRPVHQKVVLKMSGLQHPPVTPDSRYLRLGRSKGRHPVLQTFPADQYQQMFGKPARVGGVTQKNEAVSFKVTALDEDTVQLQTVVQPDVPVNMGHGRAFYHLRDDHYEAVLEPYDGELVRSLSMVGRIIEVNDHSFTIDFGHPFRRDSLQCEVLAAPIKKPQEALSKGM